MVDNNAVLQDERILPIVGLLVIEGTPVIVTPFLENGNVMEYISSNPGARLRLVSHYKTTPPSVDPSFTLLHSDSGRCSWSRLRTRKGEDTWEFQYRKQI
jgi:hypothetical protein